MSKTTRNQRREQRAKDFLWNYKLVHKCADCGESDPSCLTFHELDLNINDGRVYSMTHSSLKAIKKELERCQVLCANCHQKLHGEEVTSNILNEINDTITLGWSYGEKQRLARKKDQQEAKIYAWDFKVGEGCCRCGEHDGRCLTFHHKDKKTKRQNISDLYKRGKSIVSREIAKCIILCQNCHTKEHWYESKDKPIRAWFRKWQNRFKECFYRLKNKGNSLFSRNNKNIETDIS